MKTKKFNTLGLNKQTVAKLNDLASVKGGQTAFCGTDNCTATCHSCHTKCDLNPAGCFPLSASKNVSICDECRIILKYYYPANITRTKWF